MERLVQTYAQKLVRAGLADETGPHAPLVGGLDDVMVWNRTAEETKALEQVFLNLSTSSLVFLQPKDPYAGIINHLAKQALTDTGCIEPKDCETRTFLHDLPVLPKFDPDKVIAVLRKRKSVIIASDLHSDNTDTPAIIAHGAVSPEQGFVTISSVCFACFVKFFADFLSDVQTHTATPAAHDLFDAIKAQLLPLPNTTLPNLIKGPFKDETTVYKAVIEAGLNTVKYDLVDSYFGNVSYCQNNTLYISQTGSSLDNLSGCIDPVPLDNSTSAGLTASSELSAHLKTIELTNCKAILHGHPKFSVILSMDCDPKEKANCKFNRQCHIRCPKKRFIHTTPIVPGEVGTGPFGLCNTLPQALQDSDSAIVYGHGLFTTGKHDFTQPFKTMLDTERQCRNLYFEKIASLRKGD